MNWGMRGGRGKGNERRREREKEGRMRGEEWGR
jgi:hypothetical protein